MNIIDICKISQGNNNEIENMNEVLNEMQQWTDIDGTCNTCHAPLREKREIYTKSKILILRLKVWDHNHAEKKLVKIQHIPETIIEINNFRYQLKAAIFHTGTVNQGHYIARIKINESWIVANDTNLYIQQSWPKGSSEEAYILFYKQIEA